MYIADHANKASLPLKISSARRIRVLRGVAEFGDYED